MVRFSNDGLVGLLYDDLEDSMTLDHAHWVLQPEQQSAHPRLHAHARRLLVREGPLDARWLSLVLDADRESIREALSERLEMDVEARRRCFERSVWGVFPAENDVDWLAELSGSGAEHSARAQDTLFRLARTSEHAREVVRDRYADAWSQWLEARHREEAEWRASPQTSSRASLAEQLESRLESETDPATRFRWVAFLCFNRSAERRFRGTLRDVNPGLRTRILQELRTLLKHVEPTPVPRGMAYPSHLADEGAAFVHAVVQSDRFEWLDPPTIRRWLPTALFVGHEQLGYCVQLCAEHQSQVTREVAAEQLRLDLRTRERPVVALAIPPAWLASALRELLSDESDATVEHRARLLDLARERGAVDGTLRSWAVRRAGGDDALGIACTRWLLVDRATRSAGLAVIERIPTAATARLGECLRELAPKFHATASRFDEWSDDDALRLLGRLCAAQVPWERLPDGILTESHRLQALRSTLLRAVVRRGYAERVFALLPESERARQRRWLDALSEEMRLRDELSMLSPPPCRPTVQWIHDALRGVAGARSIDDLFFDVNEALRAIAGDVGEHEFLLLGKGGAVPRERALQEYLHARLKMAIGDRVVLSREPKGRHGDEPDFVASWTRDGEVVSIPIEVKWSKNCEWRRALWSQLVARYLLGHDRTHGFYVVGFTGQRGSARTSARELSEALEAERERIVEEHPEIRIEAIVLPIVRD